MKRVLLFAAVLFVVAPLAAAPRVQSPSQCAVLADLALNAAAHAKHGIAREKFEAMVPDLYEMVDDESKEIARLVAAKQGTKPGDFASRLQLVCRMQRGDMDSILGVSS